MGEHKLRNTSKKLKLFWSSHLNIQTAAFIYKCNSNKKGVSSFKPLLDLNTYHLLIKVNHEKNIKHFNNSKSVYITAKRHKVRKLSLREKSMTKTPNMIMFLFLPLQC